MAYLILASIIIVLVLLVIIYSNKRIKRKKIETLRATWSKPKTDLFNFESIRKYADGGEQSKFHRLTEQTIDDIDLYGLFAFIDRTTSKVGQQFLFKKLIEPTDKVDDKNEGFIEELSTDGKLREEIQLELLKISTNDAYYISSLLQDSYSKKPRWFKFLIIDIVIVSGLIILSFKFPVLLIFLIIPVSLNMFLHYWNKSNTFQFIRSFPQLNSLINVSRVLTKRSNLFYDKSVEAAISSLASIQWRMSLIPFENGSGIRNELSQLAAYLLDFLKAIFLIEVFTFYNLTKELQAKQTSILTLFNFVGSIDSSISIASLRAGDKKTCQPTFVPVKKEITVRKMYHPLVDDCVPNDLSVIVKSVLVTGSNMSGKSTFLRALTINSILAQTINTCFADEFVSPMLKQFSSIRIDDNLFHGESYYFKEVNIMATLLKQVDLTHQNLFVLDEVFSGTNTIERISAAKAILSYLNRNDNIVIVSTHDIELADMLEHEYDLYHFTETVEGNELHFDHRLKEGQLRSRNAIRILELSNYPTEVTSEARQISNTLTSTKIPNSQ